jgi:hypothetical protein
VKVQDESKNKVERAADGTWLGSGNPRGRPLGSRNKLPELIYSRAAEVWKKHEHRLDAWAAEDFKEFAQWCGRVMPRDVAVSIEQRGVPGGLEPQDWALALEVFHAIKASLPNAATRQPGEVLNFVSNAIRAADAKLIEVEPLEVTKPPEVAIDEPIDG